MKSRTFIMAFVLAFLASAGMLEAEDIRTVKAIAFKGLKLLSKHDVVRGARYRSVKSGIVIDLDSLEQAIENNSFIESYRIEEKRGTLMVTVVERVPELIVAAGGDGGAVLYELDAARRVISKNDVHTDNVPVVYLPGSYAPAGAEASRAVSLFSLLGRVKRKNPALYRELSEIHAAGKSIRVVLRGRKTGFSMNPDETSFIRLKYIAGYCDSMGHYPDEINLSGNAVIVR